MLFKKDSDSLQIARQIIKHTGLDENLGIIKQKRQLGKTEPRELLKLVMALSTCNLVQTFKAEFMAGDFTDQQRDDILRDYVMESFRNQDLVKLGGKEEAEQMRLAVMGIVGELQAFWDESEDPHGSGPGPRYYCVKEVLKRLGDQSNFDLHDALFELMYLQYKHYLKFLRDYLEKWE
jgi:hypothetical protein